MVYGAHAASGLQSARMSRIKKEDVTVLGCDIINGDPGSDSRLGDGGDEQSLSSSERGLEAGERQSSVKARAAAVETRGLAGLCESKESIPKLEPFVGTSIVQ